MKHKKSMLIVFSFIVIMLLSVVGYAFSESFLGWYSENEGHPYDALPIGSISEIAELYSTDQAPKEMIQTVYEKDVLLPNLGIGDTGEIGNLNFAPRSLIGINSYYPMECIRQVNDSLIYSVYRLADSGQEINAYFFFEKIDPSQTAADPDMEVWWLTGRVLFSCAELSYDDFSSVHIGSPVSAVAMIDPMTKITMPEERGPVTVQNFDFEINDYVEETVMPEPVLEYTEYHLLTDGILCIMYSRDSADQEFVVSSMGFNESFEVASNYAPGTVQLEIASIDYAS